MSIYVQFADSTDAVIIAYLGGPQDPVAYPNQGTVDPSDPRWAVYYAMLSSSVQPYFPAPTNPLPPPQQPALRATLISLDTSIPRCLEDYWTAVSFDTTKLPPAAQAKLTTKQTARTALAALIAAGTP